MRNRTPRLELLIRQRLHALTTALPSAQEGDADAVHRARVATPRLREALPLVLPGSRGRKLERSVRRLTRALGSVRELDVALQTLDELNAAGDAPRAANVRLKQVIQRERQQLHAVLCREVARVDLDKLSDRLIEAASKGQLSSAGGRLPDPKRLATAQERTSRRAGRLRSAIENAGSIYLPDRLHEVRIAVKKLRYALELVRQLSGSRAAAHLRRLKNAQDLLGRMHDLEVLIARVRALQGSAKAPSLRLSSDLDRLVRRFETACRQLHGHYMPQRKKLLAICDHATVAPEASRRAPSRQSSAA